MADPRTFLALRERTLAGSGADRELDREIALALGHLHLGPHPMHRGETCLFRTETDGGRTFGGLGDDILIEDYTSNIRTALKAMERELPGMFWMFAKGRVRPDEPLFGFVIFGASGWPGTFDGKEIAAEEHEEMCRCVLAALLAVKSNGEAGRG